MRRFPVFFFKLQVLSDFFSVWAKAPLFILVVSSREKTFWVQRSFFLICLEDNLKKKLIQFARSAFNENAFWTSNKSLAATNIVHKKSTFLSSDIVYKSSIRVRNVLIIMIIDTAHRVLNVHQKNVKRCFWAFISEFNFNCTSFSSSNLFHAPKLELMHVC